MTTAAPQSALVTLSLECAAESGQVTVAQLTGQVGIRRERHGTTPDLQHRLQAPGGAGVSRRRGSAPTFEAPRRLAQPDPPLVAKYEAGDFDEEAEAADLLQQYEAKIAALERLVGRQALEIEFLKGAKKNEARRRSAPTFAVAGPSACLSPEDVT